MIKLRNISKIYNEGKSNENRVLNDISLTVEEGEFVAVMVQVLESLRFYI